MTSSNDGVPAAKGRVAEQVPPRGHADVSC